MKKCAVFAAVLLASCDAGAPPSISVADAWARATGPGQSSTAAYLTVRNSGGSDSLLSVSSPAGAASLHSTSMTDGIMRMRHLEALEVPAGSTVTLEPGATHVMLTGLKTPIAAGSSFPLTLSFERSGERRVTVTVRPASSAGEAM